MPQVLIVENDPEQRELMAFQFQEHGFGVRLCGDAAEVLAAADHVAAVVLKEHPELGLTGLQLCRQLRARPRTANVPILMVSNINSEDESVEAFAAGADDWLPEPLHPHELVIRLNGLLARCRRHPDPYHQVVLPHPAHARPGHGRADVYRPRHQQGTAVPSPRSPQEPQPHCQCQQ